MRRSFVVWIALQFLLIALACVILIKMSNLVPLAQAEKTSSIATQLPLPMTGIAGCGKRKGDQTWCAFDFTRLAIYSDRLQGARVYLLGYIAVDSGVVTLYETEGDYLRGERGHSIEIRAARQELSSLVEKYGYSYARVEGTFQVDRNTNKEARLGMLRPPFVVIPVDEHPQKREGVDDIAVHAEYLSP